LQEEADDRAVQRQHDRPAEPVADGRDRPDERGVALPRLVRIDRDAARELREHRRDLGVDVVVECTDADGERPNDGRAPAAEAEDGAAEGGEQEARVGERDDEAVEPAHRLDQLSVIDRSYRHDTSLVWSTGSAYAIRRGSRRQGYG